MDLDAALDAVRTEYMRGISDAYAGGPRVREDAFDRLKDKIDAYAQAYADSRQPPTMTTETPRRAPRRAPK